MAPIKILPEIISNKIAAGEVVERPASALKELIENALDAGSSRIAIEVVNGGRSLIRISDNGAGMNHDDALMSLERYATSKIKNDVDLFNISTLGFRGEALPSIAAVSRFSLTTRDRKSSSGTEIIVNGGKILKVNEVGAPEGTLIEVKNLFFNTPARRKFLKSVNTEMGHVGENTACMALGWPSVQFKLKHNGREVKRWSQASDPLERIIDVLGSGMREALIPLYSTVSQLTLKGWITSPRVFRATTRSIYLFVNGRFIRDRVLLHALLKGYAGRLMKGRYPLAVLFLTVPPQSVDVNVHPSKHEVRFSQQKMVHGLISQGVEAALGKADRTTWAPRQEGRGFEGRDSGGRIAETPAVYTRRVADKPLAMLDAAAGDRDSALPPRPNSAGESNLGKTLKAPAPSQAELWEHSFFGGLKVIGQVRNTYLICEAKDGLIVIDQHAAHERIVYEKLAHKSRNQPVEVQRLLTPETIELGYREAAAILSIASHLRDIGVEIEPFGGNTLIIKALPAQLAEKDPRALVAELAEKMVALGTASGIENALDECLIIMACHGTIRAHQPLSHEQIHLLLTQLDSCRKPSNCPHGRPIWVKWDFQSIEKSFGRLV